MAVVAAELQPVSDHKSSSSSAAPNTEAQQEVLFPDIPNKSTNNPLRRHYEPEIKLTFGKHRETDFLPYDVPFKPPPKIILASERRSPA